MLRRWLPAIVAAVAVTMLLASSAGDALELPVRDFVLRALPTRAPLATVVVAIDEPSLRALGPWPWPRARLTALVEKIAASGAKVVVLDVLLTEAREGDAQLAAAAHRVPTIAVSVLSDRDEWLLPSPALRDAVIAAHGNFELDHDGILRRLSATKQSHDRSLTAVSLEAASLVKQIRIPVGQTIAPAFRAPPRTIPRVSALAVLRGEAANALRGKIVFIGPTALALGDRVLTPTSGRTPDPGVIVHASATESILRGDILTSMTPLSAGLCAGVLVLTLLRAAPLGRVLAAGMLLLGLADLHRSHETTPFVTLILTVALTEIARAMVHLRRSREALAGFESRRAEEAEAKRVLAHELKTPLASMRNLSQLLARFELSEAERGRVATLLESEAGKLQSMVTALLDLERISVRDFETSTAVIDLNDVVAARIRFLQASTPRPLTLTTGAALPVRADAALLERVIDNLVGNALKYTEDGVTIRVHRNGTRALLDVEDRGPGIAAADREKIFTRFVRGASAAGTEGLGLGLSLVAEIARWHRGDVQVDNAPDGGALFRVMLPIAGGS
ncbi:MAG TPA: CHASE2 domain-containing protein [Thermoanaerobaculia bacterium]|nr:CHASE2 domain-containing protein [Thermoanaerobaculia bacterium]